MSEQSARVGEVDLAYETFGDEGKPALLLVMGLGTQMLGWDEEFCALLAERGFRVVRFDNRDIGHSTMLEAGGVARRLPLFVARRESAAYLLADMANDTIGLMDHLGIESAHVVGASM